MALSPFLHKLGYGSVSPGFEGQRGNVSSDMDGGREGNESARSVEVTTTVQVGPPQRIAYYPSPMAAIAVPIVVIALFAAVEIFLPPDNMPLWLRIPTWLNIALLVIAARAWVLDPTLFPAIDRERLEREDVTGPFLHWGLTLLLSLFAAACIYGGVTARFDVWYRMPFLFLLGGLFVWGICHVWTRHEFAFDTEDHVEVARLVRRIGIIWSALTLGILLSWGFLTRKPHYMYVAGIGTTRPSAVSATLDLFPPNSPYRQEILSHVRFVRTDVSTLACFEHPSTVYFELFHLFRDGKSAKAALALLMYGGALAAQGVPLSEINSRVEICRKTFFDRAVKSCHFSPDIISVANSKGAKYVGTQHFRGPTGRGGYWFNYELRYYTE